MTTAKAVVTLEVKTVVLAKIATTVMTKVKAVAMAKVTNVLVPEVKAVVMPAVGIEVRKGGIGGCDNGDGSIGCGNDDGEGCCNDSGRDCDTLWRNRGLCWSVRKFFETLSFSSFYSVLGQYKV